MREADLAALCAEWRQPKFRAKQLLTWLPEGARLALQALEKSLAAKTGTVDGFFEAMWAAEAGAGGGQCQRLDKKREKSLLADARASMREQLQLEAQPARQQAPGISSPR